MILTVEFEPLFRWMFELERAGVQARSFSLYKVHRDQREAVNPVRLAFVLWFKTFILSTQVTTLQTEVAGQAKTVCFHTSPPPPAVQEPALITHGLGTYPSVSPENACLGTIHRHCGTVDIASHPWQIESA